MALTRVGYSFESPLTLHQRDLKNIFIIHMRNSLTASDADIT